MSHKLMWLNTHLEEFKKESDRAAVILTTSIFEEVLGNLLKQYLAPLPASRDNIFESPNAPLSTFSAKIDICYRLGLTSSNFTRDLHIIRKIRNIFSHNVTDCNFENVSVKNRVEEIYRVSKFIQFEDKKFAEYKSSARGRFCLVASWMIYAINEKIETVEQIKIAPIEWGYSPKAEKESNKAINSDGN